VELWLQVEDDSDNALLPGALDYESALAGAEPEAPSDLSADDLYILYTGGTTGMPKGVLWRQEDIFRAALAAGGVPASIEELRERVRTRPGPKTLPTPPFMHGAAHWAAFNVWHTGGTIFVQSEVKRLDPDDIWSLVEREQLNTMLIVGDAFARPLLDQLDGKDYDLASLKLVTTGGAILTAALKQELLQKLPHIRILDALGSSETGSQATHTSTASPTDSKGKAQTGSFAMAPDNVVLKPDLSGVVEAGSGESGWLARKGNVPLGYYKDAEKTAKTFPVVEGVRYSVPGDRAELEADGTLKLLGRDSVTINSGGEKIFAEEVEHALKHHPAVYDAVVVGTPSERWGQQVTAILQLRSGQKPTEADLKRVAGEHIATYKLPKAFVYIEQMTRAPSGKADYRWAKRTALQALGLES
jgi:fatty-acyl-CoA synthase